MQRIEGCRGLVVFVRLRPSFDQLLDDLLLADCLREDVGCDLLPVLVVNVDSSLEQEGDRSLPRLHDGVVQRCLSLVVRQINVCSAVCQQLAHIDVPLTACVEEGGLPVRVHVIDVNAQLDQAVDQREPSISRRVEQARLP